MSHISSEVNVAERDDFTLFALGAVLLRRRKTIAVLALLGAVAGALVGLRQPRVFVSAATFIPQETGESSGLSQAVAQLGLHAPTSSGSWGPPVYVELLHSRPILEQLAHDTIAVAELGGKRMPVMNLLDVQAPIPARRLELTVALLRGMVEASEERALDAVKVTVTSRWPSVSLALAQRLITGINQFNIDTRKSQAAAERRFAEEQSADAERSLRAAEDRMQAFLQQNRGASVASPQLAFERDRLQRDVQLRQQSYTNLLMSAQDARLREVRDTPLITVIEEPRLPLVPESRKVAIRTLLGGIGGAAIGVLIALLGSGLRSARANATPGTREFFQLLEDITPRSRKRIAP